MLLTNYSYFLHVIEFAKFFAERKLLVLDEIHQAEREVYKIVEFNFSSYYLSKLGVVSKIPDYNTVQEYVHWLKEIDETISKLMSKLENQLTTLEDQTNVDLVLVANLRKEYEMLETQAKKIEKFMNTYESTEWVFDLTESKVGNKITFKPLTIASFTKELLFSSSEKKLLMSATVGGKRNICKTLGIDQNNCEYIYVPSHFDNEKRPIYLTNSGSMNLAKIDSTLPKVVEDINKILQHHEGEKGLIHTHTYKITEYIRLNVADKYKNRIMTHTSDTRGGALEDFMSSKEPKVMVTPSMTDGIDLKDDLARFIVIVKIPYLYLGDKQIKRRMELDGEWYRWAAALTLVQAAGRAMRHENDHCTIYILDSGIRYFLKQNREFFPQYFIDSIKN
jgi:Rad3-related DNA helicase